MDGLVWGCCQSPATSEDYIQCMNCKKVYHFACVGEVDTDASPLWDCPACESTNSKSGNNGGTPMHNPNVTTRPSKRQALQSPPNDCIESTSDERLEYLVRKSIKIEMDDIVSRMENSIKKMFNTELKTIKTEMNDVKNSINYMNDKFEEVLKQQAEVKKEMMDLQSENNTLKLTLKDLNARMNILEQSARSNNVEIQCVPEKKNENIQDIISQIGTVINCNITPDSVAHYTRVAKLNPSIPRPRSIVVQFSNTKIRDQFMAAAISFNRNKKSQDKLNSSHIGLVGPKSPIFITDHLSPANRALHAATRIAAKEKGYKHVWIRGGKIFMRKRDDSDYIIVKNTDQLNNLK
ncbi:hypothetical protein ABMA28_007971 [Loxostege sticticalis]|uniref:Zinc finger PHD-type domain-containing protein n=1 Tax=Loxostege sticticalis TaxID=481309 RepID=A0ABD0SLV3_LOXSC